MTSKTNVIPFPDLKKSRKKSKLPRQRVFYLGSHMYSNAPGMSGTSEYWVKRIEKGKKWELFGTWPEECGRQRLSMGEHTPEQAKEYFESVNFEISSDEWFDMGWRDNSGENVVDFIDELEGSKLFNKK